MKLSISGHQVQVGKSFQVQAEEVLKEFYERHRLTPIDTTLTVSKQGAFFHADLAAHIDRGVKLRSRGEGSDAYISFSSALEKLTYRLRRHKKRLQDHYKGHDIHMEDRIMTESAYLNGLAKEPSAEEELAPAIIAEMHTEIKSLSVGEAAVILDLEDRFALIFRNKNNDRINILYRREDGNIGWADPKEV